MLVIINKPFGRVQMNPFTPVNAALKTIVFVWISNATVTLT